VTLASYFNDLTPIVLRISGDFAIRWYGLSYVAGFVIAWAILFSLAKRRGSDGAPLIRIPPHRVGDALMWLVFGTIAGGRLGYCIFYEPSLLIKLSKDFPFWGVLAINKGGMASHFAILGCVLASWRISRGWKPLDSGDAGAPATREGVSTLRHVIDMLAITGPFGLFLGRIANFVNGELLGKVVAPPGESGPAWSVQFPTELLGWSGRRADGQPGLVRDALSHAPELSLQQQSALDALVRTGASIVGPDATWRQGLRYVIENAARFKSELAPLTSSRHPSQLYQALAEGLILAAVSWVVWWFYRKREGVTAGVWLMVYGVLRIVTELYRLPDAQFGDAGRPLGLSRGQWFSVGMVLAGAALFTWAIRSSRSGRNPADTPPVSG